MTKGWYEWHRIEVFLGSILDHFRGGVHIDPVILNIYIYKLDKHQNNSKQMPELEMVVNNLRFNT